jgi:hypothetical protein
MIKNITAGPGITVNQSYSSWPSFYNTPASTGNSLVGQMRYNGSSQNMEVYDGNVWLAMSISYPTIELAPEVQSVLNWARIKMAEETRIRELASKNPTVADALAAFEKAQEQLDIVATLTTV